MDVASGTDSRQMLRQTFKHAKAQTERLGMNLMLWDANGVPVEEMGPCCEVCRMVSDAYSDCKEKAAQVAGRVLATSERCSIKSPNGCMLLGVEIRQRRHVLGAATVCYPAREMADEETLARMCDRLELDREVTGRMIERQCRFSQGDARRLLDVLEWELKREQEHGTAQAELSSLSMNLGTTYEELSLVYRISGSMRVTKEPAEFLRITCQELLEVMNVAAAAAFHEARPEDARGSAPVVVGELGLDDARVKAFIQEVVGSELEEGGALVRNEFDFPERPDIAGAVRNYVAVPLIAEGERTGILVAVNKLSGDFDSADHKLLNSIGNQASVFLANNRLYADVQGLLMGVLHALTEAIDAKDPYTSGHSQRVALISRRIATNMGFNPERVEHIYLCGLLHDIGKIGVPEAVLCKPGRLTNEEYEQVQRHPTTGARILGGIRQLDGTIPGILAHHERPDGRGYPRGIRGEEVPVEGRIIGLADSFDAMTSDRTYRKALRLEDVLEEIRKHAGTQFDEQAVEALLAMDVETMMAEVKHEVEAVLLNKRSEEMAR